MSLHTKLVSFLADEVEPSLERERIKDAHREVRDMAKEILEDVLINSFVMGSYKRHTLVRRLDASKKYDVDVMFVLDEKEELESMLDTMEAVASSIADQIDGIVEYRRQRVSVGLIYDDNFSIDMVPGVANNDGTYNIFDSRELKPVKTDPLKHVSIISGLNSKNSDLFIPLIKLVKRWKQENASEVLKSFHLEMLAVKIFENAEISDLTSALKKFFNEAHQLTSAHATINDPVGGHDIASYLDSTDNPQRAAAITALNKASAAMDDAVKHENDEDDRLAERAIGRLYSYFKTDADDNTAASISSGLAASNAPKPWSL
ncbi:MAG: hypothetical protein WBP26_00315 [Candidatus Saccharimonadales bacterium]